MNKVLIPMKHSILILILATLKTGILQAALPDSIKLTIEKAVVNAGWLQDWRGAHTQWQNISGVRAEVTGYVSVGKRIRFFKNHTFEIAIFREPKDYYTPTSLHGVSPCRGRQEGEMPVITGNWSVKKDSIYLSYKTESFYNYEEYSEYQALRKSGETSISRPKSTGKCKIRRKETYLWQDGKVCLAAATNICFK